MINTLLNVCFKFEMPSLKMGIKIRNVSILKGGFKILNDKQMCVHSLKRQSKVGFICNVPTLKLGLNPKCPHPKSRFQNPKYLHLKMRLKIGNALFKSVFHNLQCLLKCRLWILTCLLKMWVSKSDMACRSGTKLSNILTLKVGFKICDVPALKVDFKSQKDPFKCGFQTLKWSF